LGTHQPQPTFGENQNDVLVILVHGTFARDSAWPKGGSPLCCTVLEKLPGASVKFVPFRWTGCNSHRARIEAGLKFRRFMWEQFQTHPQGRKVVIAHSHGGNVALYGLRRFRGRQELAGLVTLGTPFIHCAPTDLAGVARIWKGRIVPAALLLMGFAIYSWVSPTASRIVPGWSTPYVPYAFAAIPLSVLVTYYLLDPKGPFCKRWARIQARAYVHRHHARPSAVLSISKAIPLGRLSSHARRIPIAKG
jgi:hypothetical protein